MNNLKYNNFTIYRLITYRYLNMFTFFTSNMSVPIKMYHNCKNNENMPSGYLELKEKKKTT